MPNTLTIQLVNRTTTPNVFAYITGLAIQHNMARVFLKPDGHSLYYPASPPPGKILQPLAEQVAIPLGAPNNTVTVTIPQIAGGRIWFSADSELNFLLNPGGPGGGAALVEPSVLNPSDPNSQINFTFCEFTLNNDQLFANISYVDFVSRLPIALTLQSLSGQVQHVSGMGPDPLPKIAAALEAQAKKDGWPWDKLIVRAKDTNEPLRILNPTHANAVGASFDGYFEPLVEAAWQKYRQGGSSLPSQSSPPPIPPRPSGGGGAPPPRPPKPKGLLSKLLGRSSSSSSTSTPPPVPPHPPQNQNITLPTPVCHTLKINTQASPGIVSGSIPSPDSPLLISSEPFSKPTTSDIFSCNTGPFTTGPSPLRNAIIPRLAASFQRSTIAHPPPHVVVGKGNRPCESDPSGDCDEHPSHPSTFYKCEITNHYSRIVHEHNLDGKGYAFAYDDVQIDEGEDQSGKVNAGDPRVWVVEVGGRGACLVPGMSGLASMKLQKNLKTNEV
ncbi:glycoside hydrolase [Naviculisporaceae sp. PSN 640]